MNKHCCNCENWRGTNEDEHEKCYLHAERGYLEYTRYDEYCDLFEPRDEDSLEQMKKQFEFNPKQFNREP